MSARSVNGKPKVTQATARDFSRQVSYLSKAFGLIWTAARKWTIAWAIFIVIQGILPAATVYLTKLLVDGVAAAIGGGFSWEVIQPVVIPSVLMGAAILIGQLMHGIQGWIRAAQAELVQDHIKALIHNQATAVDLEFYDTPEYFDHMARANGEADSRSMSLLQNLGGLIQNSITLIAIAALLIPYSIWLPFILLLSTLPALWVVVRHSGLYHEWWEETTEKRRWAEYYDQALTFRNTAPEVRIFGLADYFKGAYMSLRKALRERRLRLMRDQNMAQMTASVSALFVTIATLTWMGWRALHGLATLGDLALFYQAFNQGQTLMRTLLSSVGQLYADTLFLQHLFTFLKLKPRVKDVADPKRPPLRLQEGIEIKDVTFRYPGSEHLALKNFSLTIPAGKTVAIVGANGAGKSTLIKLLCRFYDPADGSVEIDGVDIRQLKLDELWERIAVLFQNHVNYAGTVRENIIMGDLFSPPDEQRIRESAVAGGADEVAVHLPRGYDTLLGKQFNGGAELSGGQWQRLALARAFYRGAPVVMLDEPTSFMDSWAETRWLDGFLRLVRDQTAIVVTHRFTTAMRADIIHVMDQGRVVESGTHKELLALGGLYAGSWKAQMETEREESQSVGSRTAHEVTGDL